MVWRASNFFLTVYLVGGLARPQPGLRAMPAPAHADAAGPREAPPGGRRRRARATGLAARNSKLVLGRSSTWKSQWC